MAAGLAYYSPACCAFHIGLDAANALALVDKLYQFDLNRLGDFFEDHSLYVAYAVVGHFFVIPIQLPSGTYFEDQFIAP